MERFTWSTESALSALHELIGEVTPLRSETRFSAKHMSWVGRTTSMLEEVFGSSSRYFETFMSLSWRHDGQMLVRGFDPQPQIDARHHAAYLRQLDTALGLLEAASAELERKGIGGVYKSKDASRESGELLAIVAIAERKLRKVIRSEPKEEREVQDALQSLLIGADIPYSREVDRIEYSSKSYIPDFTFKQLDLALELKLCNNERREKQIISEINDDVLGYRQGFANLMFLVYDVGQIRDVEKFAQQFESLENVTIRVIKH